MAKTRCGGARLLLGLSLAVPATYLQVMRRNAANLRQAFGI